MLSRGRGQENSQKHVPDSLCWLQVRVEIESLAPGVDLSEPLTRARFEELNADLFKKTLGPVRKVCTNCRVLLTTLIPCVHAAASQRYVGRHWSALACLRSCVAYCIPMVVRQGHCVLRAKNQACLSACASIAKTVLCCPPSDAVLTMFKLMYCACLTAAHLPK